MVFSCGKVQAPAAEPLASPSGGMRTLCWLLVTINLLGAAACQPSSEELPAREYADLKAGSVAEPKSQFRSIDGDARPSVELGSDDSIHYRFTLGGRLYFDAASASETPADLIVEIKGDHGTRSQRFKIPSGADWRTFEFSDAIEPGARVTVRAAAESKQSTGCEVWVANLMVERSQSANSGQLVVLILIDTLGANRTSLHGYSKQTSPDLEALAQDSVTFRRAYSTSSWTRPSVASLLTSLSPDDHGLQQRSQGLRLDARTWPEIFRERGFLTVGITTNPNVLPIYGLAQGFARFVDLRTHGWLKSGAPDAAEVFAAANEVLDSASLPLLLYVHLMDPHNPYDPSPEVASKLYPDYSADSPGASPLPGDPAHVVRAASRRYEGEVLQADEGLGSFIEGLQARGLYQDATIVVAADHGEEFGEHGGLYHGTTLYEEVIHIPLVIKLPGGEGAGTTIDSVASLVDVVPTVADAIDLQPAAEMEGRSALDVVRGEAPGREVVFAAVQGRKFQRYAAITATDKLIRTITPHSDVELYDIKADPGETSRRSEPETEERLLALLDERLRSNQAGWHIRLCGRTYRESRGSLSIEGTFNEVHSVGLEQGDRLARSSDRVALDVLLRPETPPAVDKKKGRAVRPDRDGVRIIPEPGSAISLRASSDDTIYLQAGREDPQLMGESVLLDGSRWTVAPYDTPQCPGGRGLHLQVWKVAERRVPHRVQVDQDLTDRLEALGYVDE